jgi:hypothetical protein
MNGTLGRDKVWNDHIWSEIDKAVRDEVGRIRVAQKVFPSIIVNSVLPVSTTRAVPFGPGAAPPIALGPGVDAFQPLLEISREFVLSQAQVEGEENVHLGSSFARLAASAIAAGEDTLLFLGPGSLPALIPPVGVVNVTNQPGVPPGFVAEANNYAAVPVPPALPVPGFPAPPPGALGDILTAVAGGMAALSVRAQPGPYALFLSPNRYAQTFAPAAPGALQTPGDQINHVVTGGFDMVNSLAVNSVAAAGVAFPGSPPNPDIGILVSLGGEPAKIIVGTEAVTAFTYIDPQGNYHFRVFERIQMVVRDGRAFQTLTF